MTLVDEVYAHARILASEMSVESQALLETVCRSTTVSLQARLRDNLTAEDCKTDFIAAASMMALAAMSSVGDLGELGSLEQITAGDLSLKRSNGNNMAAECLRSQAEMLMVPYIKDPFVFLGV